MTLNTQQPAKRITEHDPIPVWYRGWPSDAQTGPESGWGIWIGGRGDDIGVARMFDPYLEKRRFTDVVPDGAADITGYRMYATRDIAMAEAAKLRRAGTEPACSGCGNARRNCVCYGRYAGRSAHTK